MVAIAAAAAAFVIQIEIKINRFIKTISLMRPLNVDVTAGSGRMKAKNTL